MRTLIAIALTTQILTGCGQAALRQTAVDVAVTDAGSLSVGTPRLLSAQVNPMLPIGTRASGGIIAVTFARRGQRGSVLAVDPDTLCTRSSTDYAYASKTALPAADTQRVTLADGGSVLLWTEGSAESGRRAMAQSFAARGTPRSAPVVLSPAGMDVFGTPRAATIDGHHVVATLSATEGKAFELVAVPIEAL
jgi:hypothetical protein